MTEEQVPRARTRLTVALCLLVSVLLVLLVARRAWGLRDLGGFGVPVPDALAMAVQLALAGGALVLLARTRRTGLPGPPLAALALAAAAGALLLWQAGTPQVGAFDRGWFAYSPLEPGAYSSTLTLSFAPELRPGRGLLIVAVLGLLPVAGLLALLPGRRLKLPSRLRALTVLAAAVAALLVLRDLDRALALRELLQWQAQQLDLADAVTAVAAAWSLVALLLSATALVRGRAGAVAVVVPCALLLGWGALLLADPASPACCYGYSPMSSQGNVFRDYGVLLAALAVGLLPLLVGQLRRVIRTASTPPG